MDNEHENETKEELEGRRAATQAFFESLDKLCDSLNAPVDEPVKAKPIAPPPPPRAKKAKPPQFSFADLEDAIADIENYLAEKHTPPN
jgi:hypothetical protein